MKCNFFSSSLVRSVGWLVCWLGRCWRVHTTFFFLYVYYFLLNGLLIFHFLFLLPVSMWWFFFSSACFCGCIRVNNATYVLGKPPFHNTHTQHHCTIAILSVFSLVTLYACLWFVLRFFSLEIIIRMMCRCWDKRIKEITAKCMCQHIWYPVLIHWLNQMKAFDDHKIICRCAHPAARFALTNWFRRRIYLVFIYTFLVVFARDSLRLTVSGVHNDASVN